MIEEAKKAMKRASRVHTSGRFHFDARKAWLPAKSETVPMKQNQPHPILPTNGDKRTNDTQMIRANVMTPQ
ncbi:hypothetical protein FACS189435_1790 [Bacteroidia bacterium]|nr:hypothetical protein FACS189435_1790 [Bacteroidia bacterium]